MIISKNRLRLYYWNRDTRGFPGPCNLPEIEKGEYGYILEPGQKLNVLRYEGSNREMYIHPVVEKVDEEGIYLLKHFFGGKTFVPWKKELPNHKNELELYELFIEPCEILFEKNKMKDILSGTIRRESREGTGIWYQHGGWRIKSVFECNLKNFVKLGQQSFI